MKKTFKIVGIVLGVVVVLVLVVVAVGAMLPARHEIARTVVVERPLSEVWEVIVDFPSAPEWRPDVQKVERLPDRNGMPVWAEYGSDGQRIPYATVEAEAPRRLVREIADPGLPFGGTWTFELAPAGAGTRVTVTERGEVRNPVFRFVSKFVIGHETFMVRYLEALGARFDQDVEPVEAS